MAQAKTLTTAEIEQVLAYLETRKYKERNRAMFFMSLNSEMESLKVNSNLRCFAPSIAFR